MPEGEQSKEIHGGINIFNFDPVEQNKIWLQLGPTQGRKLLLGVLRTALLLGRTVEFDRNQVFEGVFFTATSPDLLRWHLGLEPGAMLPFKVRLLPSDLKVSVEPGPWTLGNGERRWGVGTDTAAMIRANLVGVQNPTRPSSPLIALTGGQYDREDDRNVPIKHSSSGAATTKEYMQPDPVVMPEYIWAKYDKEVARSMRNEAREEWAQEMLKGLVAVIPPGQFVNPDSSFGDFLKINPKPKTMDNNVIIKQLISELVDVSYADGPQSSENMASARRHVSSRSELSRWFDGETISGFSRPKLPAELVKQEHAGHRSAALAWWTRAYYAWITHRDGTVLLTLSGALQSPTGLTGAAAKEAEQLWGLNPPKANVFNRLGGIVRSMRTRTDAKSFTLSGKVVDEISEFTPDQYSRLQISLHRRASRKRNNRGSISNGNLNELSLAVHELRTDHTPRSSKMRNTVVRVSIATITGLALVIAEGNEFVLTNSFWAAATFVVAGILAIPWSDISALVNMSDTKTLVKMEEAQWNPSVGKQFGPHQANGSSSMLNKKTDGSATGSSPTVKAPVQ